MMKISHRVVLVSSSVLVAGLVGTGVVLSLSDEKSPAAVAESAAAAATSAVPTASAAVAEGRRLLEEADRLYEAERERLAWDADLPDEVQKKVDECRRKAATLFRDEAEKGNADARYEWGTCLLHGYGVEKNARLAMACYRKAVEQGHAGAMNALGSQYVSGNHVEVDWGKAFELFNKSAEGGCRGAWENLAYSYFYGWGVTPDGQKSIECCLRGLEKGGNGNLGFFWVDRDAEISFMEGTTPYNRGMSTLAAHGARDRLRAYLASRLPGENLPEDPRALLERGMELAGQGDAEAAFRVAGCFEDGYYSGDDGFADGVDGDALLRYYHMAVLLGHQGALGALAGVHDYCHAIYRDRVQIPIWEEYAAESGSESSAADAAVGYSSGFDGREVNPDRAAYWYHQVYTAAAEKSSPRESLRELFKEGKVSLPMLHFLAGKGNPEALASLGQRYEQGIDARLDFGLRYIGEKEFLSENSKYLKDKRKAVPDFGMAALCYRRAAEQGDVLSLFRLGVFYAEGKGVAKDAVRAELYLNRAVSAETTPIKKVDEDGDVRTVAPPYVGAMPYLAQCYEEGGIVDKDVQKAAGLYFKAIERGDKQVWERLETLLRSGEFSDDMASYGDRDATARMLAAMAQRCGKRPEKVAAKETLQWTIRAANMGDRESCLHLASCHEDGRDGLPKDMGKAVEWLQKAVDNGSLEAMMRLAQYYEEGRGGLQKDMDKALEWLGKAAEDGSLEAMLCLAQYYERGEGVEKDMAKAASFYKKAADTGSAVAQVSLARCYLRGEGVEKDPAQGVAWCKKGFYQLDEDAALLLAECYEKGEGVAQNAEAARKVRGLVIKAREEEEE